MSVSFSDIENLDTNPKVRTTATKAELGEKDARYTLEFRKKRYGQVVVKWHGYVDVPTEETRRCDLGHRHPVIEERRFVWNELALSASDLKRLREFLE